MGMKKWKVYAFWILLCEAVGALAGWLAKDGIRAYQAGPKPVLSPPGAVFGIVWGLLYLLMGYAGGRVTLRPADTARNRGLNLLVVQLAVNFSWPLLFFNMKSYAFALLWLLLLLGLVFWMVLEFSRTDKKAAWSQVPYLLWLCFAVVLNDLVLRL